jgi:peptidyl-tRNA hydrolase
MEGPFIIRVGIARPPGTQQVASYVLEPFSKAERVAIDIAVQVGWVGG